MTEPLDLDKYRALADAATPGPWGWHGHDDSYSGPFLGTWLPGLGLSIVMDFVRLGMRRAQPRFNVDGMMVKACPDLAVQEVDYRADIAAIDHPDAAFIAAAREAVPALCDAIDALQRPINSLLVAAGLAVLYDEGMADEYRDSIRTAGIALRVALEGTVATLSEDPTP